jgi:hypothetical protein
MFIDERLNKKHETIYPCRNPVFPGARPGLLVLLGTGPLDQVTIGGREKDGGATPGGVWTGSARATAADVCSEERELSTG